MTREDINELINKQRGFFESGATYSVKFRKEQLKKLYNSIKENEEIIC